MQSQSPHPRSNGVALSHNTAFRRPAVRSVHFAPSVEMPSLLSRSRTRNAPYAPPSSAPSARSWVYPYNQHEPTPLPPSPTDQSSPLPGPFHKHNGLHATLMGYDDDLDDTDNTQTNSLGIDFGHHQPELSSSNNKGKKSIIGRVFRGVGHVFGKEPNSNDRKLKRKPTVSYDNVPSLATYGDSGSNPSSAPDMPVPLSTLGPGPSHGIRVPYNVPTPIMEVPETEDQSGSPPPDVLRLSDNIPPLQSRPHRDPHPASIPSNPSNQRPKSVSRKPVNAGTSASRFVESAAGPSNTRPSPEDRTTVMIYDHNASRAPTGVQTPQVISRHPSSTGTGAGLPFQPLRPTSFAPTQQTHAAPGSIRDAPSIAPTRRTSIASPLAPRSRQVSLNRGVVGGQAPSASSIPDFPPGPYPAPAMSRATSVVYQAPMQLPLQTTITDPDPDPDPDLTSPISAHPLPSKDYLKMTLSPPSSKHTMTTSNTTYSSNPSFSSDLSPFARFVKTLYKMPWISHDRVTVDYLPDHGLLGAKKVKSKKGKVKRMGTWYRSMLASQRNSDNPSTDLLGGGGRRERRRQRDLDASLGAALAELGSPFAATRRRKGGRTERSRRHHHHHHHHHRHHHTRQNHHHSSSSRHHGRRTTTTTMSDDSAYDSLQSGTPLAPAGMYPYFPPFPIAFQSPFPQNEQSPPAGQGQGQGLAAQQAAAYQQQQQHLFSPAPFYVYQQPGVIPPPPPPGPTTAEKHGRGGGGSSGALDSNTRTSRGSHAAPPALVPGGVDREHVPGGFS